MTKTEVDASIIELILEGSWTVDRLSEPLKSLASKIKAELFRQLQEKYTGAISSPQFSERKKQGYLGVVTQNNCRLLSSFLNSF